MLHSVVGHQSDHLKEEDKTLKENSYRYSTKRVRHEILSVFMSHRKHKVCDFDLETHVCASIEKLSY